MEGLTLPTGPVPAETGNPEFLILYAWPERFGPLRRNLKRKNI